MKTYLANLLCLCLAAVAVHAQHEYTKHCNKPFSAGEVCEGDTDFSRGRSMHYWNNVTKSCEVASYYKGCGGNMNKYKSIPECRQACDPICQNTIDLEAPQYAHLHGACPPGVNGEKFYYQHETICHPIVCADDGAMHKQHKNDNSQMSHDAQHGAQHGAQHNAQHDAQADAQADANMVEKIDKMYQAAHDQSEHEQSEHQQSEPEQSDHKMHH